MTDHGLRPTLRALELVGTGLLVVLFTAFLFDAFWFIPATRLTVLVVAAGLGVVALLGAGFDGYGAVVGDARGGDWSWRIALGFLSLLAGGLAALTLLWVLATVQTLLFPPERGGVLFGPLLALLTGTALALVVLVRESLVVVGDK